MASWLTCNCGRQIHKNLFSGANLRIAIDEEFLDRDFKDSSAEDLVTELILHGDLVLSCQGCGRLYLVDERGNRPTRAFAPVG